MILLWICWVVSECYCKKTIWHSFAKWRKTYNENDWFQVGGCVTALVLNFWFSRVNKQYRLEWLLTKSLACFTIVSILRKRKLWIIDLVSARYWNEEVVSKKIKKKPLRCEVSFCLSEKISIKTWEKRSKRVHRWNKSMDIPSRTKKWCFLSFLSFAVLESNLFHIFYL